MVAHASRPAFAFCLLSGFGGASSTLSAKHPRSVEPKTLGSPLRSICWLPRDAHLKMGPLFYEVTQNGNLEVFLAQKALKLVVLPLNPLRTWIRPPARTRALLRGGKGVNTMLFVASGPSVYDCGGESVTSGHNTPVASFDSLLNNSDLEIDIVLLAAQDKRSLRLFKREAKGV